MPKNSVTCQASGSRSSGRSRAFSVGADADSASPRFAISHTTSAAAAGSAHIASATRHEPNRSASGTDTPAAIAAIPTSAVMNSPVINPVRAGKRCRTSTGSETLPIAIAVPASAALR